MACSADNKLSLRSSRPQSYLSECSGLCMDDGNVIPQTLCEYNTLYNIL